MISNLDVIQILLYVIVLAMCTPLVGSFLARVLQDRRTFLTPVLAPVERWIYRLARVDTKAEMSWKEYVAALLAFNFFGFLILFLLQLFQFSLPLNPQHLPGVTWHLALNTAVSFMTNTNWQSYAGETTLSYLVQMAGLTVQNFVSAATGIAVMVALIRGLVNKTTESIGNFWVDLVRSTMYILLPLTLIWAILLAGQGVVQTFTPYTQVKTLEGTVQTIPLGPVASQVAIKQLGTNGGGFFNTNSSHPFENPTPFSNFLEMLAILLLPSALVYAYGKLVGAPRQGRVLWGVMMILFLIGLGVSLTSEYHYNPVLHTSAPMEGKETRFGVANSVLWSVATTDASNGSVNAMHDSFSPVSGMVAMINMMLGEVIFGGVGAGMYGIFIFVVLTVFIAGLMVGRSPEYLGKKIESFEVKMAAVAVLLPTASILVFSAVASVIPAGLSSLSNSGPHGLSQILYAFTSGSQNNGSAFAGLNANTSFYNLTIAGAMLIGRFGVIVPVLAIAGSLGRKKITPPSSGTFRTDTVLFGVLLVGVILIVGGLDYLPALSLGPIVEHMLMLAGRGF